MLVLGRAFNSSVFEFYSENNKFGEQGLINLAPYLKKTSLTALAINNADISDNGVKFLVGELAKGIKFLNLGRNFLGNESLKHINEAIKDNKIQKLDISSNNINDEGVEYLLGILKNRVKVIYFSDNSIEDVGLNKFLSEFQKIQQEIDVESINFDKNNNLMNYDSENKFKNKNGKFIQIMGNWFGAADR